MSGQHVQCACGEGNFGTVRSMMSRPRESEIYDMKIFFDEIELCHLHVNRFHIETFRVNCCWATSIWYFLRILGVNCVMRLCLFVRHMSDGVLIPHVDFLVILITNL